MTIPQGPSPAQPFPSYPPLPPYSGVQQAPRRRRRSRWLTIGLPLAVVLLLGGCGLAVGLLVSAVKNDLGPAQDAAGAYARALVEHRWDDAHDLLCVEDQAAVTATELAAHYAQPELTDYSIDGVRIANVNGRKSGQVDLTLTTADGLRNRTTLPMTTDGTSWRPCP
jgi:hypothetical protein